MFPFTSNCSPLGEEHRKQVSKRGHWPQFLGPLSDSGYPDTEENHGES